MVTIICMRVEDIITYIAIEHKDQESEQNMIVWTLHLKCILKSLKCQKKDPLWQCILSEYLSAHLIIPKKSIPKVLLASFTFTTVVLSYIKRLENDYSTIHPERKSRMPMSANLNWKRSKLYNYQIN